VLNIPCHYIETFSPYLTGIKILTKEMCTFIILKVMESFETWESDELQRGSRFVQGGVKWKYEQFTRNHFHMTPGVS